MNVFRRLLLILPSALALAACDPGVQDIRIAAQEFRFVPAEVRLDAYRPVRLTIVNEGRELHNFTSTLLANPQVRTLSKAEPPEYREVDTLKIPPGRSATITLNVPPGMYVFYCKLHGHSGMVGTIMAR
jgi:plastocyanin